MNERKRISDALRPEFHGATCMCALHACGYVGDLPGEVCNLPPNHEGGHAVVKRDTPIAIRFFPPRGS